MGQVEGQRILSSNDWEQIKRNGEQAIKTWIATEMNGKSCVIVLIGERTAGRKWVKHEIQKAWQDGKGLFGIYIHNLKDLTGNKTAKGRNPFDDFTVDGRRLSAFVKTYDPPYSRSQSVYNYIKENLATWVEQAIKDRA
jgi:hypothetical protein